MDPIYHATYVDIDSIKECKIFPSELLANYKPNNFNIEDFSVISIDGLNGLTKDRYFYTRDVIGFSDRFREAIQSEKFIRILDNYYSVKSIYNDTESFIKNLKINVEYIYSGCLDRQIVYGKIIPFEISLIKDDALKLFLAMNVEPVLKRISE